MTRFLITIAVAMLVASFLLPGCSTAPSGGTAPEETTDVKSMDEYRVEAAKEITAENAEAELDKLTKEIEADQ
jgi:hypothetical protein